MRVRKSDPPRPDAAPSSGAGCVCSSGTSAGRDTEEIHLFHSAHRAKSSKKSRRRERGQKVPTPDRISEIQQALAKDGSFKGTPNGKWDAPTMEATRKFQEAHGLNPTGKLDAKTLQQLGLGSHTAGVAPPMTPISSSSLQKTPSSPGTPAARSNAQYFAIAFHRQLN